MYRLGLAKKGLCHKNLFSIKVYKSFCVDTRRDITHHISIDRMHTFWTGIYANKLQKLEEMRVSKKVVGGTKSTREWPLKTAVTSFKATLQHLWNSENVCFARNNIFCLFFCMCM